MATSEHRKTRGRRAYRRRAVGRHQHAVACSALRQATGLRVGPLILALTVVGGFCVHATRHRPGFQRWTFRPSSSRRGFPAPDRSRWKAKSPTSSKRPLTRLVGLDTLSSVSSEGTSQVIVGFRLEKNVDTAAQEVRDRVNRVLPRLPRSITQPDDRQQDPDAQPILSVAVTAYSRCATSPSSRKGVAPAARNRGWRRSGPGHRRTQVADQHPVSMRIGCSPTTSP